MLSISDYAFSSLNLCLIQISLYKIPRCDATTRAAEERSRGGTVQVVNGDTVAFSIRKHYAKHTLRDQAKKRLYEGVTKRYTVSISQAARVDI